jgi:hypothetical protein
MRRLHTNLPSQRLRALLAGLLLAFALSTVAHASHQHDPESIAGATHVVACSYCNAFGGMADLPVRADAVRIDACSRLESPHPEAPVLIVRCASSAHPRAPPRS